MYQIVVSVMPKFFDAFNGPAGNCSRPHSWVSASGDELPDMIQSLRKHAARDMKMSDDELGLMERLVLNAWTNQLKNTIAVFSGDEFVNISILDAEDIAARDAALAELGFGGFASGGTVH